LELLLQVSDSSESLVLKCVPEKLIYGIHMTDRISNDRIMSTRCFGESVHHQSPFVC
jgi:hypothetical protein